MKLDLMSEIQTGTPPAGATKPVERPAAGAVGGGRPAAKASGTNQAPASGVTVTLSAQSQSVNGTNGDVVDTGKVEAMKSAIANGSFAINAEAIADKLISNARVMLTASRR